MARVKRGVTTHARHKKIVDMGSGYFGRSRQKCECVAAARGGSPWRYAIAK